MKKLFIHSPIFRLLSPMFSGFIIYFLILLVNNNIEQLLEQFIGEELYFCVILSYTTQEFSRVLIVLFKRVPKLKKTLYNLIAQILLSVLLCIGMVTLFTQLYFTYFVGYSITIEELYLFNSIYVFITLIYISLFISHQYLYKINTERMTYEAIAKENIEHDFVEFKRGINPNLLIESFEALIVLIHQNKELADDFIDHLATIYRYILSSKKQQLISVNEEILVLEELEALFNKLPYRTINLTKEIEQDFLMVPGTLLYVLESIVRNTIVSNEIALEVLIKENGNTIEISYKHKDKLSTSFLTNELKEMSRVLQVYSDEALSVNETENQRIITIPKLQIQ